MTAIAPGVFWVGAVDWNIRDFHGYATHRGTTYNAYLVVDEKIALIDTVEAPFKEEMLRRIAEVCDPARIDYAVSLHVEQDHSSGLPFIMERAPGAQVVTLERFGQRGLEATYHAGWRFLPVKEGSQLSLGKRHLTFIPTPMVHWPDNMMAYLVEDGVLFSSDCYGQHLATSCRTDDGADLDMVLREAEKYYANIFMPYATQAGRAVERTRALAPAVIAPSHGVVWRQHRERIVEAYGRWTQGHTLPRVLVIYDTMWGSTDMMAHAIGEGASGEGVEVQLHRLTVSDMSDIVAQVLEAAALCVGSPVLRGGVYPTVAAFLSCLRGLKPQGKVGVAFSSYGWSGVAAKAIQQELEAAGVEVLPSAVEVNFVPTPEALERCRALGVEVARRVKAARGG